MQVDFLIVGQGLAGSLLAKALLRRGRSVHVVDDRWKSSSSQVAAGLMTPLTGRRFTLTKDYPELFAAASTRLTELGVFRPIQVYRMFVDDEQRAKGLKRTECTSCQPFIAQVTSGRGELDAGLTDAFGGALMNGAWVDLPKLMSDVRAELVAAGSLTEASFDPADAVADAEGVCWRNVRAGALIYCDGYKSAQRGPFTYLPWQPAKGEALTLRSDVPDKPFILNREGWALPLGQGVWRTATNRHGERAVRGGRRAGDRAPRAVPGPGGASPTTGSGRRGGGRGVTCREPGTSKSMPAAPSLRPCSGRGPRACWPPAER